MFFTFPDDARWDTDRQAVEFSVEIGEYSGVVRVPRRVFQRLLRERPTPERCVEAYYLQRTPADQVREPGVGSGAEAQRRNSGIFQLSFRVPIGAVTPGLRATAAPTPPSSSGAIGLFVPGVAAARSTWG